LLSQIPELLSLSVYSISWLQKIYNYTYNIAILLEKNIEM
jgi:hypothetical protein